MTLLDVGGHKVTGAQRMFAQVIEVPHFREVKFRHGDEIMRLLPHECIRIFL